MTTLTPNHIVRSTLRRQFVLRAHPDRVWHVIDEIQLWYRMWFKYNYTSVSPPRALTHFCQEATFSTSYDLSPAHVGWYHDAAADNAIIGPPAACRESGDTFNTARASPHCLPVPSTGCGANLTGAPTPGCEAEQQHRLPGSSLVRSIHAHRIDDDRRWEMFCKQPGQEGSQAGSRPARHY